MCIGFLRHARIAGLLALGAHGDRPGRIAYLVLTIATTLIAWLALSAMASPFIAVDESAAVDSGITVRNARSSQQMLPLRYAARISAIAGVGEITYGDLSLVSCAGGATVTVNAFGGSGVIRFLQARGFASDAVNRWQNDRLGLLVGKQTAADCGWQEGVGITPLDLLGSQPLQLHVSGIAAEGASWDSGAVAHYDFINHGKSLAGPEQVLSIDVTAKNPHDQEALAARIEAEFVHADPPLTAYPDSVAENVRSRMGKVQYLLALVMGAVFCCCGLVLASVFAHVAAERRAQLAVLRVLGFSRRILLSGFVLECVGIAILGAAVGLALSWPVLRFLPHWLHGLFGTLAPAPWAWGLIPVWLSLLLLTALAMPASIVLRVQPTDCQGE